MFLITEKDVEQAFNVNGLWFRPISDLSGHYGVALEDSNRFWEGLFERKPKPRPIIGQTKMYRYAPLFDRVFPLIQDVRPDEPKRVFSGPSSIVAEGASFAAKTKQMGRLPEYFFECVDVCPEYINHGKTMQFPIGMLFQQPDWMHKAFRHSSTPPSNDVRWVEPVDEIKKAIQVHEPADIAEFQGEHKYDVVFIMTLFLHLTASQQDRVLQNMIAQCNGLFCLDVSQPVMGYGKDIKGEKIEETMARIQAAFNEEGYLFADPEDENIKPYGGPMTMQKNFSGMSIAIHPDLAAEMS